MDKGISNMVNPTEGTTKYKIFVQKNPDSPS